MFNRSRAENRRLTYNLFTTSFLLVLVATVQLEKEGKKKRNKEHGNKLKQLRRVIPVIPRPVTKSGKLDGQENVLCVQSRLLQLILLFGQQRQNKDIVRGFAEGMFKNVIIAGEKFSLSNDFKGMYSRSIFASRSE